MSKIRVDTIVNEAGSGAPNFSSGLTGTNGTFTGNLNVTGNISAGGTITYEDVTSVDSVGIVTARTDLKVNRNAIITGITTFTGALDGNGGANIQGGSGVVLNGLTYPGSDGSSGQYLKTDGSGALSFATVSSGGGKVINVWYNADRINRTYSGGTYTWIDVPNLSRTITPASATSRFWIHVKLSGGTDGNHNYMRINCNGTTPHIGEAAGSATRCTDVAAPKATWDQEQMIGSYLYEPATTSAITIKAQYAYESWGSLNRGNRHNNNPSDGTSTSDMTIFEFSS